MTTTLEEAGAGDDAAQLDKLAEEIKKEHQAAEAAMRNSLVHARRAGELLLTVKATLEHGQFGPWIQAHCGFTWRTANIYVRIARKWDTLLEQNSQSIAKMTLAKAADLLTVADDGDSAEQAAALEEWGILDRADLDGLSPREARMVVKELGRRTAGGATSGRGDLNRRSHGVGRLQNGSSGHGSRCMSCGTPARR